MNTSDQEADAAGRRGLRRVVSALAAKLKTRRAKLGCLIVALLGLAGFFMVGLPILIFAVLVINGLIQAGEWKDDPKNWGRAFSYPEPKEVQVVHSIYFRSPHFTREESFAFQFKTSPGFLTNWAGAYKMSDSGTVDPNRIENLKRGQPSWFLPKSPGTYHSWPSSDPQYSSFNLFTDNETGEVFCTYTQY